MDERSQKEDWLELAQSSEAAGRLLAKQHPRAAVSRFYFAAYSAVQCLLIGWGQDPPSRGNWGHHSLDLTLRAAMSAKGAKERESKLRSNELSALYDLRIAADYGARRTIGTDTANEARKLAGPLVRFAEKQA